MSVNNLTLAKFAFNIYGSLSQNESSGNSPTGSNSSSRPRSITGHTANKLVYNCEREVTCLSELNYPLGQVLDNYYDQLPANHVIVGGKNYLKLLVLNADQSAIINELNIMEQHNQGYTTSRIQTNKLVNVNTIKSHNDTIACGLANGVIAIYKVGNNGKSKLIQRLSDHKRCVNTLDFIVSETNQEAPNQLLSGSQDGTIKLWDLRTANPKPVLSIISSTHSDPIRSCQYSSHSPYRNKLTVLSVHDSGSLCKYDLRSPSGGSNHQYTQHPHQISMPERKWNFHTGPALSLHIHPEREYVITGGRDKKLCIWNYGDSASHQTKVGPEHIVSTYGPVMKVRWSPYPNSSTNVPYESWTPETVDVAEDYDRRERKRLGNPLYNYDFACLYLNEDTTITVYNLKRKYIPKEIVNTSSHKPFQNFIWAENKDRSRRLWTVTKSNRFASYELDHIDEQTHPNILRPLNHLSAVAMTWDSGLGDFCFVSQKRDEFQQGPFMDLDTSPQKDSDTDHSTEMGLLSEGNSFNLDHESSVWDENSPDARPLERQSSPSNLETRFNVGSIPVAFNAPFNSTNTSVTSSPVEKPSFSKSATHAHLQITKSPSPIAQPRANPMEIYSASAGILPSSALQRPSLKRTTSQSTQGSGVSISSSPIQQYFSQPQPQPLPPQSQPRPRKLINVYHPSPYLVPLSIPLPLNNEQVFKIVADSYMIEVPESFELMDVCTVNARIASTVGRYRDCQIWRMLGASLEQAPQQYSPNIDQMSEGVHYDEEESNHHPSILSDLGNFVGSYNSNSTLTTNYGATTTGGNSVDSGQVSGLFNLKDKNLHTLADKKNGSSHSLNFLLTQSRPKIGNTHSISPSRSNSNLLNPNTNASFTNLANKERMNENESAIADDDGEDNDINSKSIPEEDIGDTANKAPRKMKSLDIANSDPETVKVTRSYSRRARHSFGSSAFHNRFNRASHSGSEDLDNENLNILNNAANSFAHLFKSTPQPVDSPLQSSILSLSRKDSSVGFGFHGSHRSSHRNSQISATLGFHRDHVNSHTELLDLEESPEDQKSMESSKYNAPAASELTKAIHESESLKQATNQVDIPWGTANLLNKALEYAKLQGDIIMTNTLILLFYRYFHEGVGGLLKKEESLESLALYVDILRKKQLFVNAVNVVKAAPSELKAELSNLSNSDVNLRFYCSWCQKLLVNEESKARLDHEEFGFWYCDECSKKQHNCIYCDEPCKGLNVVMSLKCGHRGHFGCLRGWFVEEENTECPGGCGEQLFV